LIKSESGHAQRCGAQQDPEQRLCMTETVRAPEEEMMWEETMTDNPLLKLQALGQSIWMDFHPTRDDFVRSTKATY